MKQVDKKESEEIWDKKKILITLLILLVIIGGLIFYKKDLVAEKFVSSFSREKTTGGISVDKSVKTLPNVQTAIREKIDSLKKQAEEIDVAEIASSSPQIQKVIKDLKALENLPRNQAKSACEKICSGI